MDEVAGRYSHVKFPDVSAREYGGEGGLMHLHENPKGERSRNSRCRAALQNRRVQLEHLACASPDGASA